MPLTTYLSLLLIVITAAGMTILAATQLGLPFALLGVVALLAAAALRLWR